MKCPECGSLNTKVKETRHNEEKTVTRRRHYCHKCCKRFSTFEQVETAKSDTLERIFDELRRLTRAS